MDRKRSQGCAPSAISIVCDKRGTYTYSDRASTAVTSPTPATSAIVFVAGEMIEDPMLAARASMPNCPVTKILYHNDQSLGFSGSSTSQSTIRGSLPFTTPSFSSGRSALVCMVPVSSSPPAPDSCCCLLDFADEATDKVLLVVVDPESAFCVLGAVMNNY